MKIYISVDMEGICGVNTKDHVLRDGQLFPEARTRSSWRTVERARRKAARACGNR